VRHGADGASGLTEIGAIVLCVGILTTAGLFTYKLATNSGNDQGAQSNLQAALGAANDVYNDTQDYTQITQAQQLQNFDHGATFTLSTNTSSPPQMTTYSTNTFVAVVGALSDGDAGGYIGLATLSQSGTCWQIYSPADGSPVYGSTTGTCSAPTSAPSNGTTTPW
jgi:type II secretory pathway pseudopilin PulG